jgi:hypothetical protein
MMDLDWRILGRVFFAHARRVNDSRRDDAEGKAGMVTVGRAKGNRGSFTSLRRMTTRWGGFEVSHPNRTERG